MDCPMLRTSSDSSVQYLVKIIIVRENNVSTHVEEEAFWGYIRHGKSTSFTKRIHKKPVFVLVLFQTACRTKSSRPCSDNNNIYFLHSFLSLPRSIQQRTVPGFKQAKCGATVAALSSETLTLLLCHCCKLHAYIFYSLQPVKTYLVTSQKASSFCKVIHTTAF